MGAADAHLLFSFDTEDIRFFNKDVHSLIKKKKWNRCRHFLIPKLTRKNNLSECCKKCSQLANYRMLFTEREIATRIGIFSSLLIKCIISILVINVTTRKNLCELGNLGVIYIIFCTIYSLKCLFDGQLTLVLSNFTVACEPKFDQNSTYMFCHAF